MKEHLLAVAFGMKVRAGEDRLPTRTIADCLTVLETFSGYLDSVHAEAQIEQDVRVILRPLTLINKPLVSPQPAFVFVTKESGVAGLSNDERHAKNELLVEAF